jgi:outer membrane protein insertion porin family
MASVAVGYSVAQGWATIRRDAVGNGNSGRSTVAIRPSSPLRLCRVVLALCSTFSILSAHPAIAESAEADVPPAASNEWGQPVVRLRLDCDAHLSLERFADRITQQIGEPLNRQEVSQSLKNLFATGRFDELRAEVEPAVGGVELVFVAQAAYFVGVVHVEGAPDVLDPRVLETASRLRLGEPLHTGDLAAARDRLMAVMAENGYYEAQIRYTTNPNPDTQVAEIVFSLSPGPAARLTSVAFEGHLIVPVQRLIKVTGWRHGSHLTSSRLERGLFKLHRFYQNQGRLRATVGVGQRTYDSKRRTERLVVQVEAGPLIRVRVEGAPISNSKKKEILPFYRDGVVDETALERGRQSLEDFYQRQGYYSVSVKGRLESQPEPATLDVIYSVQLGLRGTFVGYEFKGNGKVSHEELARVLSIHPKDFIRERGMFSRELLQQDVEALTAVYEAQGFLEAQITPRTDQNYEGESHHLFITFEVREGPRTRVGELSIRGVNEDMQKEIWPELPMKPGQPFSPTRANRNRDLISGILGDHGYMRASVTWTSSPGNPNEVNLEYVIVPGEQEFIERVAILGGEHTRTGTIRRELIFHGGEPLSQSKILDSQRQLYDLGTFSQVQIATQDPHGRETDKTVLVDVEEARRWSVAYGGGMEFQRLGSNEPQGQLKVSPRLSLEVTRLNVGGRAQTLTLRGRLSTLEKGGAVSYLVPRFPTRRDLAMRLNLLAERSQDVLTFTSKREEASVSLEKRWSAASLLVGRYTFRRVQALDISNRISEAQIPLLSRPARVALLGLSYANDHRDDPADATDGSYSLADAGLSWTRLGSQSNFVRISGQNATYHRLASHLILARNTRFAVETSFGHLGPENGIPLPERFFMGGSESHRAFSINQAGPRDPETGYPIGGNALFLNSVELRVPFAGNRLGFALFHDAGNVYSSIRRMRLLKVTQSSPTDFDYTAHAVGLGIRYRTPVGPVRLDVGYNLNPPRYQVVVDDMTKATEIRRLSHFQFFLSIGQSF